MASAWRQLGLIACLLFGVLIAGCTTRRPAAPPPPSYPAVPANSVRIMERLPSPPYEVVSTITEQTNAEANRDQTISEIRQRAGNGGANAIVIISEKVFTWRNDAIRQRLHTRRIVVRALRLPSSFP
ncbi:MAG TPA: hypothetical protein VE242_04350 [Chthoniobacterales bacterium]|jgi:hypothetical protein|nr:hypothetical protein [Chthoniobacterales bacterium]